MATKAEIQAQIRQLEENITYQDAQANADWKMVRSGNGPHGPLSPGYKAELQRKIGERTEQIKKDKAKIADLTKALGAAK